MFPNPSNGVVNIKLGELKDNRNISCVVSDLKGEVICIEKLNSLTNQIKLNNLNNGLYFIQIYDSSLLIKTVKLSVSAY